MSVSDESAPRVDIVRGSPTAEELAAIITVVGEAYLAEVVTTTADDTAVRRDWTLTRRLRRPIDRASTWGRFRG